MTDSSRSASSDARAGGGGVDHDLLVPVGDVQGVAVDGDRADQRVLEGLAQGGLGAHVVGGPQPGELLAAGEEFVHQPGHLGVFGIAGGGGAQPLRRVAGERVRVRHSVQPPPLRVRPEEDTAYEVAVAPRQGGEVLHEGGRQIVPGDHLARRGRHDRGGLRQPAAAGRGCSAAPRARARAAGRAVRRRGGGGGRARRPTGAGPGPARPAPRATGAGRGPAPAACSTRSR